MTMVSIDVVSAVMVSDGVPLWSGAVSVGRPLLSCVAASDCEMMPSGSPEQPIARAASSSAATAWGG